MPKWAGKASGVAPGWPKHADGEGTRQQECMILPKHGGTQALGEHVIIRTSPLGKCLPSFLFRIE